MFCVAHYIGTKQNVYTRLHTPLAATLPFEPQVRLLGVLSLNILIPPQWASNYRFVPYIYIHGKRIGEDP